MLNTNDKVHCPLTAALAALVFSGIPLTEVSTQEREWRVDATPSLSIEGGGPGGVEGDLYDVRGIALLSDGSFAVADGLHRVLVFDGNGGHIRTLGREGSGPGEFGSIQAIQALGDTLVVFDFDNNRRVSYFAGDGSFVRSTGARAVPLPMYLAVLSDGTLVGTRIYAEPTSMGGRAFSSSEGVWWGRGEIELLLFGTDGRIVESLGAFPGPQTMFVPGLGFIEAGRLGGPLRRTMVAAAGASIYLSTGDDSLWRLGGPGESQDATWRSDRSTARLTPRHLVEFFAETELADYVDWRSVNWNIPADMTTPLITDLQVARDGTIWLEEGQEDGDEGRVWRVLSPAGAPIATVAMPDGFRPVVIESDRVLGVWRDELGVEQVELRGLRR
jgi:hypothetical protein